MPRAFICISGIDQPHQLSDATSKMLEAARAAGDELNVIRDGGHGVGLFMMMGLLIETRTDAGLEAIKARLTRLVNTPGTPCAGCAVAVTYEPESAVRRQDPPLVMQLKVKSADKPEMLSRLASYFARHNLVVVTHRGRHVGPELYEAEFCLAQIERRVDDFQGMVGELKDMDFDVERLEIHFHPDRSSSNRYGLSHPDLAPPGG